MLTRNYLIVLVLASILLLSGCATLIGLGVGYSSDRSSPSETKIASALPLDPGTEITAVMKDSTRHSGLYDGYCGPEKSGISDTAYSILPYYGEPIEIIDTLGITGRYVFKSFFFHERGQDWIPYMTVSGPDESSKQFDLRYVRELRRSDGSSVSQNRIQDAFAGMRVPALSCLVINDSLHGASISLEQISYLETPLNKSGAKRGFIIGLITDTFIWSSLYLIALSNYSGD